MLTSLKVSNLPLKVEESKIESMFSLIGNVKTVSIVRDATSGASLGIALVEMSTEEESEDAILHYNGKSIDGHSIFVQENKPRTFVALKAKGKK